MSFHFRRRRRQDDHHVDDWLMTYADMITLLLCFFAVFLSVSVPKQAEFEVARQKMIEKFSVPDLPSGKNSAALTNAENPEATQGPNGTGQDEIVLFEGMPNIVDGKSGEDASPVEEEDGDLVRTFDMDSAAFFARGSADLSEEGKRILDRLFETLQSDEYVDFQVTVEGHTDDNPINTLQFPSNWELSTARAASVVRYFLERGVDPRRLRAAGYADTFPKVSNRDYRGNPIPENQAQNRRVVIKLEKKVER